MAAICPAFLEGFRWMEIPRILASFFSTVFLITCCGGIAMAPLSLLDSV
jgi:hypothetical protein